MVSLSYENNKERISAGDTRFLIALAGLTIRDQKRSENIRNGLQTNSLILA
jgi:hypothetical protein